MNNTQSNFVIYYFGTKNLNFNAIETIVKNDYQLISIFDQNMEEFPVNPDLEIIAIIVDVDVTFDWGKKVDFILKQTSLKPPVIAVSNSTEIKNNDIPNVTDLIKFVNIMQIKNQAAILKNKIDWYRAQLLQMEQQAKALAAPSLSREKAIAAHLTEALLQNHILIVYHPMVNLKEDSFDSFEVLFKWDNGPVEHISSEEIVNAAESLGIIDALTIWMTQKVCAFQHHLKEHNNKYYNFEIDLSINQVLSDAFFDSLKEALNKYHIPPEYFSFEISSEVLDKPLFKINKIADKVNELGVKLSIDCVTEDNISLAKISALPTSHLKVNTMHLNNEFELLSKMAHEMGLKLIAKNAEADENQGFFLNEQIDYAQDLCLHQRFEGEQLFASVLSDKDKH